MKTSWMTRSGIAVGLAVGIGWLFAAEAADPVVSNVRAAQRAGTGLFDITYDLEDADTTNLTVTVAISTNNGSAWFVPASSNLTGSVGAFTVSPGTGKSVLWQGGRELPAQLFPFVRAKIAVDDTPPPLSYLVINLSGGTNSASYPVAYYATSNALPSGANSDVYKTTNLLMRLIPKGSFTMGSPDELGRDSDETQHTVTLTKDFYIGVFEVTQRQWELVMGDRPSWFNNAAYYAMRPVEQVSYYDIRENPTNSDDPAVNWPANSAVNTVSFMGKLRAKTGLATFDLPTESQWEYACRAGTTTALNSGKNLTSIERDANMAEVGRYYYNGGRECTQDGDTSVGSAKVGTYLPNAWGLYDMHGNVFEWCLDWYGSYPGTVSDPGGAASGPDREYRGGSWFDYAGYCRSAVRRRYSLWSPDYLCNLLGFRAARTLPVMAGSASDISPAAVYDLSPPYLALGLSSVVPVGVTNAVQAVADNSGDGGTSIKLGGFGLLADGQMAGIQWTVTGSGVLAFDWKVSSEADWDVLCFYEVGGALTNYISGTIGGWSRVYATISGAPDTVHTFRWEYEKDPYGDYVGSDCGWVDAASWSPVYALTVDGGAGDGVYTNGTVVTITADAPPADQKFDKWAAGDTNIIANIFASPTVLSMPANHVTVSATYVSMLHGLTVINGSGGGMRREGSTVSVIADPDPIWKEFAGWIGDAAELLEDTSARTTTLTMPTGPATLTATYRDSVARVAGCYGRTFTVSGTAGGVTLDASVSPPSGTPVVKLGGAGVVPDSGTVAIETVVSGSGTVTFWWKVSSESNADYLKFKVDGTQIAAISGTKGAWAQVTNRVEGAGASHTLRWEYAKNASSASSTDAGWVDDIIWNGDVPAPVITPDIRTTTSDNNLFTFTFWGERGIPYTVYSNATLGASGWAPMAIVPQEQGETNGLFRFLAMVVPDSGKGSCFYRMFGGAIPPPPLSDMVLVQGGSLTNIGNGAITVSSFYIGKYEVTWAEWQTVRTWAAKNGYDIGSVGAGNATNHPVQTVSWYDCVKWCNARSQKEGRMPVYYTDADLTLIYKAGEVLYPFVNAAATGYRLPTDAEWEFAARGGTQSQGYVYSGSNDLNVVGWYLDNSGGSDKAVGTKEANELGLYDMSGNVWEWCLNWYPGREGWLREARGGSCSGIANLCRPAFRGNEVTPDGRFLNIGFRAARALP